ncbi:hypothetical protein KCP76_19285 [Salmonella enterica subsp. enterica serovar Weltevreden]|nr:hypothetical protein KCP76_19285 [Salmonella enterica subsp. enterica serovar Weltevreden]
MVNHGAFKAGLIVAGIALILNAASDTFILSLLKPYWMMVSVKRIAQCCCGCRWWLLG